MTEPAKYDRRARFWLRMMMWSGVGGIVLLFGGIAGLSTLRGPLSETTTALVIAGGVVVVAVCATAGVARMMWRRAVLLGASAELRDAADGLRRAADEVERRQRRRRAP